jgi:hypothetical protein
MIDIKAAVKKAKEYLVDFFPEKADSIRLEETELDENGNFWKVTLSFIEENDNIDMTPKSNFSTMFSGSIVADYRVYKSLKVRAKDGEVLGMTIWKA